uniref:FLYWCH-type domain-containing protein n=1 Tax=Ditylenchus dipsaci TaxID=166011 RepID=A0A915EAQ2_9BILA
MENEYYTEKGKPMGFCNGYAMRFRRGRKHDGKMTWQCAKKSCGGTATSTSREDLIEENDHHCLLNIELVEPN